MVDEKWRKRGKRKRDVDLLRRVLIKGLQDGMPETEEFGMAMAILNETVT